MSAIASKNLYELLGNDRDEDSDKEPEPPVKVIDKTPARTTKRNATGEAPATKATEGRGPRRGGLAGNEGAFRDRNAGSANNREKPTDGESAPRGDRGGRGRGGRGRGAMDRHSRTVGGESEKQAAHGWGAVEGDAELADEQAGDAIASAESKEALTGDGDAAWAATEVEVEPEDNSKSYADYIKEQEEARAALLSAVPEARKANEGSKLDKKWANAKPLSKEDEEDFVSGSGGKAKRERERKQKTVLEIDQRFVEAPERSERGGRGGFGGRGGRGRGDGAGRGRGSFRGGPGGERREARNNGGPRSAGGASNLKIEDTSAFPSLGGN